MKGSDRRLIEVLSRNLRGRTNEAHEKPGVPAETEWNRESPEYESKVFHLHQPVPYPGADLE
jgi:hypothetical protein